MGLSTNIKVAVSNRLKTSGSGTEAGVAQLKQSNDLSSKLQASYGMGRPSHQQQPQHQQSSRVGCSTQFAREA